MFVGANKSQQLSELRCFGSWRGTVHHVFIQDQWRVNKTSHYVFLCRKPITGHSHQCLSVFHLIPFYPHEIPSTIFFLSFCPIFKPHDFFCCHILRWFAWRNPMTGVLEAGPGPFGMPLGAFHRGKARSVVRPLPLQRLPVQGTESRRPGHGHSGGKIGT